MIFGSLDGEEDGENHGVSFVETFKIFATQDFFKQSYLTQFKCWTRMRVKSMYLCRVNMEKNDKDKNKIETCNSFLLSKK